jgi:hypothetical protein
VLGLHARASVEQVLTPGVSFGGNAGASVSPVASSPTGPWFGFALGYLGNDLLSEPDDFKVHLTTASVSACPLRPRLGSSFFVSPCGVVKGGFLEARGLGVSDPKWVFRTWWSLGAEVVLELDLGAGMSVELAPSLDIPLIKREFTSGEPPEAIGETPAVSAGVNLGIGYHFQ